MTEQNGDLLILGAQGHGFLHRIMLGSVALHQIAVEEYPVLIVRS
jgi:nucleotide-binding universal stress UspA family protein